MIKPKTSEDLVQFLLLILRPDYSDDRMKALLELNRQLSKEPIAISDEQCRELENAIAQSIMWSSDYYMLSLGFMGIIGSCRLERYRVYDHPIDSPTSSIEFSIPEEHYTMNLRIDLLKQAAVLGKDEEVQYEDFVVAHLGNRLSSRIGNLFVTNKRLVVLGHFDSVHIGNSTVNRIFYEDMANRPYLQHIDFIDYSNIHDIKKHWSFKKKHIEFLYQTKVLKEKARILYGPYFFKTDLPSTLKVEKEDLRIELMVLPMADLPDTDNTKRLRLDRLYSEIANKLA